MIELRQDSLRFSFPEVHPEARLQIDFQRTLRIPDDDREYPLPPGLGCFPVRHVDDFADRVPARWLRHGGVMLPMYQSEAMWLSFMSPSGYPFAVKIAAGKINAVTGETWSDGLHRRPQDYLSVPEQPWLDGFCVRKGVIRQFVAMPLGSGYSAEEQITGAAEHGGVQIAAYPLKVDVWNRIRRERPLAMAEYGQLCASAPSDTLGMGLAPGGQMRQVIYDDPHGSKDWDTDHGSRCFVHLCNALVWRAITRSDPPTTPPTAEEYTRAGLPWFDYYAADLPGLKGSPILERLKSVVELGKEKGDAPLPENAPVDPEHVIQLRRGLSRDQVREGRF